MTFFHPFCHKTPKNNLVTASLFLFAHYLSSIQTSPIVVEEWSRAFIHHILYQETPKKKAIKSATKRRGKSEAKDTISPPTRFYWLCEKNVVAQNPFRHVTFVRCRSRFPSPPSTIALQFRWIFQALKLHPLHSANTDR